MASPTALREWCRATCARYPGVEIWDLCSSFRDGLAFCAIIHKHRPDLIEFSSLSKDNVYLNNKLAFEISETKLGIPALLDPNDMVSNKVPDYLSVITYLSWHYSVFNKKSYAGLASLGLPHVNITRSKATDTNQSLADIKNSRENIVSSRSPRTVCPLCFKPVHLIQRHLIDGKVYHRSCFRCAVCRNTLLPGSYTQGSDAGTFICTHHTTGCSQSDLSQQDKSAENQTKCQFQEDLSLSGLVISSVPHYSRNTVSLDGLVCETTGMEGTSMEVRRGESRDPATGAKRLVKRAAPPPPVSQTDVPDKAAEEAGPAHVPEVAKTPNPAEGVVSPCETATEGSKQPVPAPRRRLSSSVAPVPAPRTRISQPADRSTAAGSSSNQPLCSPTSCHITRPTSSPLRYKANHPWMKIVNPGPWKHLPPAGAPVPTPRTWYKPRVPTANPFDRDVTEDTEAEAAGGDTHAADGSTTEPVGDSGQIASALNEAEAVAAAAVPSSSAAAAGGTDVAPSETQSNSLPRSLSVPVLTFDQLSLQPADMTEKKESDQVTPCQSKKACKENPFDRKPTVPKSKTFQTFSSRRAPAPGHGFPLIKRKVQSDRNISTDSLQVEMRELAKRLEELECQGVELERNLRDCKNDKEEERMLLEWFCLHHARHLLVRRDTELCHLTMQQRLEERQADVEYELRCLLNKQECDWTQEDRDKEQQLMNELVSIIDQRNQIINSLDQDVQRERGEDQLFEATIKNKDLQKERLKELRRSKGKFSPSKVFKRLNSKAECSKDSVDKKS